MQLHGEKSAKRVGPGRKRAKTNANLGMSTRTMSPIL